VVGVRRMDGIGGCLVCVWEDRCAAKRFAQRSERVWFFLIIVCGRLVSGLCSDSFIIQYSPSVVQYCQSQMFRHIDQIIGFELQSIARFLYHVC
jgi:hypothetical protein